MSQSPDVRRPNLLRRLQLRWGFARNYRLGNPPYQGVRIRTLGEVLFICLEQRWRGGLPASTPTHLAGAGWFVSSRGAAPAHGDGLQASVDLRGADLHDVNLEGADLHSADLQSANLAGAVLRNADLTNALLTDAIVDRADLLPQNRAQELRTSLRTGDGDSPPCAGIVIRTRNELLWIMRELGWTGKRGAPSHQRIDLRGADVSGLELSGCDLAGARFDDRTVLVPAERAAELRGYYRAEQHDEPYAGASIRTRNELLWIVRERHWQIDGAGDAAGHVNLAGADFSRANLRRADLRGANLKSANLQDADLRGSDFTGANLLGAVLIGASLFGAEMGGAVLRRAQLANADLRSAILAGAHLYHASLDGASLEGSSLLLADLRNASLVRADVRSADLRRAKLDVDTVLQDIRLNAQTRLGGINWNSGVLLNLVNWQQAPRLGDEELIATARGSGQVERLDAYRSAVQAYVGLAVALRSQGAALAASTYRMREQRLQRLVLRTERRFPLWVPAWVFSVLLELVAGFGERPMRTLALYLAVIVGFAGAYFAVGQASGPALSIGEYLIFSITVFHGRGFFPEPSRIPTTSPIPTLATIEAVIGLVIELTFVASFARRFLSPG